MAIRFTRTRIIGIAIGLGVLVLLAYALRPDPLLVQAAIAEVTPLEVTVQEDGRARLADRYLITAPVSGRLERIEVREGDDVKAGAVLARIRPMPLDAPAIAELEARLASAEARHRSAAAALAQAEAALEQAERELERRRTLAEQGAIAAEQVEQYALARQAREQELSAARNAEAAAVAEIEAARTALAGARDGESRIAVRVQAPVTGNVLRIPERSGRIVMAGEPIIELGETGALEIVVDVLSTDAVRIDPGMPALLTGWGGSPIEARVRVVEPAAFTRISALGVEEQRVNVILDPVVCPPGLGDGYRVDVSITLWQTDATLTVPGSALFRTGNEWSVFVIEDGRAQRRTVQIGRQGELRTQILGGLEAGDTVIVFPSDQLRDGTAVRAGSDGPS